MKKSISEFIELNGMRNHVRIWGPIDAPRLILLHGWMDASATFQFVVDAFARDWRVIAPDWRGFGQSQWNNHCYWFPDYVADLDALLAHYSPDAKALLVGHSMGGGVATMYAGIRPERVARLVSMEGFGTPPNHVIEEAPESYAKWLDQLRAGPIIKRHRDRAEFAARLRHVNSRLTADRAAFLAEHTAQEDAEKQVMLAADPFHRIPNPVPYRFDDVKACWQRIVAPVLWVAATDSYVMKYYAGDAGQAEFRDCVACFRDIRVEMLEDAGHNMHHDQPERMARLIEEFCA